MKLLDLSRDRIVVLTFDDAVRSHREFVAPLLAEHGFGATFFVSHGWMPDRRHFMSWEQIAEIHALGFEIGNHSWTHSNFVMPRHAARMAGELGLVNEMLRRVGVPKPISFAWCSNGFHPESLARLRSLGYSLARRGMQPEVEYGRIEIGPLFRPGVNDPLLIPTTGDSYPTWTVDHFERLVERARPGEIVVLQYHGVPDIAHPWVHTPPDLFRDCMRRLASSGARVVALRDLLTLVQKAPQPVDPLRKAHYPPLPPGRLEQPIERIATRSDTSYWLPVMRDHRFTMDEAAGVLGWSGDRVRQAAAEVGKPSVAARIRPYPGGRHPRAGFLDGALDPHRGSKFSLFAPGSDGYVVIDLPEAVFSGNRLIYLAHTHIPTVWDERNIIIENSDWERRGEDELVREAVLPDGTGIGSRVRAVAEGADLEWSITNRTDAPVRAIRAQMCAMLKAAAGFEEQTNDNKIFTPHGAAVASRREPLWLLFTWQQLQRNWGNPPVPCLHADPAAPDCEPGSVVAVRGAVRWYRGHRPQEELARLQQSLGPISPSRPVQAAASSVITARTAEGST